MHQGHGLIVSFYRHDGLDSYVVKYADGTALMVSI
jgi:hypothetical protein